MSDSAFGNIQIAPPIEVFALVATYNEDNHPDKVNLSVGAYRTEEGKPWVLPVVRRTEITIANDQSLNKEYLAVAGLSDYVNAGVRLMLGDDSVAIQEQKVRLSAEEQKCLAFHGLGSLLGSLDGAMIVLGIQALGGTGALRTGADLLKLHCGKSIVYVTDPTWGNHIGIFSLAGLEVRKYKYWNPATKSLAFDSLKEALNTAPEGSVFVLHAIAHNPTGVDPTREQWMEIADIMKARNLFPFFDCAYQGFATGDLDSDAWAIRYFVSQGFELIASQSFSKNFGMYNERVGNLIIVSADSYQLTAVKSQVELIVRKTYSNPPSHGARVIAAILNNPALNTEWRENVVTMAERIKLMRQKLYEKLKALGTPGNWEHIVAQQGMFSYTGLSAKQVEFLCKEYHIYLMKSGRINMCGLSLKNLDYVSTAIHEAVCNVGGDPKL